MLVRQDEEAGPLGIVATTALWANFPGISSSNLSVTVPEDFPKAPTSQPVGATLYTGPFPDPETWALLG